MARRPVPPGTSRRTGFGRFVDLVRQTVPPIHPAGLPFVGGAAALAVVSGRHRALRRTCLVGAALCAVFFRHPERVSPTRSGVVVAPADGIVALVDTAVPPPELDMGGQPLPRVSVFLSVFDVHVQRAPISGVVRSVQHRPGKFLSADLPEASSRNERNSVVVETESGQRLVVVQIAGLLARRIVCEAVAGDTLEIGETYGLIRFGSRVDTYFPANTELLVAGGQRTIGGETVLAVLPAAGESWNN